MSERGREELFLTLDVEKVRFVEGFFTHYEQCL